MIIKKIGTQRIKIFYQTKLYSNVQPILHLHASTLSLTRFDLNSWQIFLQKLCQAVR